MFLSRKGSTAPIFQVPVQMRTSPYAFFGSGGTKVGSSITLGCAPTPEEEALHCSDELLSGVCGLLALLDDSSGDDRDCCGAEVGKRRSLESWEAVTACTSIAF